MDKAYTQLVFENEPSVKTPLNAQNLNDITKAVDTIDNRVIALHTGKADLSELSGLVRDVQMDEATGQIIFTKYNGGTVIIDTMLEKLAVNFGYDYAGERLIIYLADGTEQYVDLSRLITQYEFLESDTIVFTVAVDGKVTAVIKKGSITGEHLNPDYLAQIQEEVNKAGASAQSAGVSALESKRWAVGEETNYPESVTDNAKYYAELAKKSAELAKDTVNVNLPYFEIDVDTMHLTGTFDVPLNFYIDENGHFISEVVTSG